MDIVQSYINKISGKSPPNFYSQKPMNVLKKKFIHRERWKKRFQKKKKKKSQNFMF